MSHILDKLDEGEFAPTLELKTQFIAPAKIGKIFGVGKVTARSGKIAFREGELYQDGRLIAKATATAIIKGSK